MYGQRVKATKQRRIQSNNGGQEERGKTQDKKNQQKCKKQSEA
jgi:hypothetical protein